MANTADSLLFEAANTDLDPGWRDFLERNGLLDEIRAILTNIERAYYSTEPSSSAKLIQPITSVICPAAQNILAFARYPFERSKIMIIGQDPYPRRINAHGLTFSVPRGVAIPASLMNIYKALVAQKLIPAMPTTGNLETWATQGIVLINTALTTIEGNTGLHLEQWQPLTRKLVAALGKEKPGLIYFLFGGPAQKMKSVIPKTCIALEWGHPSPTNQANIDPGNSKNFLFCPVFRVANNMLVANGKVPINWNPHATQQELDAMIMGNVEHSAANAAATASGAMSVAGRILGRLEEIALDPYDQLACPDDDMMYAFVDGAARGNGKASAVACYATLITSCTTLYRIVGQVSREGGKSPTNNRAELMALRDLFVYLASDEFIDACGDIAVTVVYDSAYAAGCLREWYARWRTQEKPEVIKANLDIISVAYDYMQRVESARKIHWVKVNSHIKAPEDEDSIEWYYWYGNSKADEAAQGECEKIIAS